MRDFLRRFAAAALAAVVAVGPAAAEVERYHGGSVVSELVTRLLEQTHYAHHPIDEATSQQFLKMYIDSFDYNHMILEKSDVDELTAKYGSTLGGLAKNGDVEAAYEIYNLVLKRLEERVALVKRLTSRDFDFTKNESVVLDRHDAPWPATHADLENLWRLRIKHEVLLERMSRMKAAEAKAAAASAAAKAPAPRVAAVSTTTVSTPAVTTISSATAAPAVAAAPAVSSATAAAPEKELSIKETIDTRYERLLRSYKEYDGSDILQDYLSALAHVYDPHSDYLAAAQKENFDISMKLSLVGIGAVLRSEDGYAKIVSLVPGGPADSSKKIKPNDRLEAVAQGDGPFVEVVGMKLDRVVALIRGEKGTIVRLRILPANALDPAARATVSLVRDEIKLTDQEAKARLYTVPVKGSRPAKIGVLDLPSFYADMRGGEDAKSLTRDTARLLAELRRRGADAIVVDLRANGGGALSEAVSLSGLFIKEGPVVQVKDARGTIRVLRASEDAAAYPGPLVVLTSRGSASAAEIFTAAMQDYARGVVVGDKTTFGKGTVQSVLELSDYLPPAYQSIKPGALKLTVQKFYRVSGGSTQNRGVIPDIHLPSGGDVSEMTESAQPHALPYDEIEPADYTRSSAVDGRVPALEKDSARRVAASKEFRWIKEDLERWEKQKKDKALSLNEKTRLAQAKADEEREAARKKERADSKVKPLAFDEITLATLDGKKPAVASSTAAASAAAATSAVDPLDDEDGPARAPDAPDAVLEETLRIASDLAAMNAAAPSTASRNSGHTVAQ
ncbi:MAG: carboxy terminal-processing peptidase [Elusimicrobia bacterium]|nr:carboxy terminal-processing peptidase [Elusimicrobiota bacterium]